MLLPRSTAACGAQPDALFAISGMRFPRVRIVRQQFSYHFVLALLTFDIAAARFAFTATFANAILRMFEKVEISISYIIKL